jgi:hypothetical protein
MEDFRVPMRKRFLLNSNGSVDESFAVEALKGSMFISEALPRNDGNDRPRRKLSRHQRFSTL